MDSSSNAADPPSAKDVATSNGNQVHDASGVPSQDILAEAVAYYAKACPDDDDKVRAMWAALQAATLGMKYFRQEVTCGADTGSIKEAGGTQKSLEGMGDNDSCIPPFSAGFHDCHRETKGTKSESVNRNSPTTLFNVDADNDVKANKYSPPYLARSIEKERHETIVKEVLPRSGSDMGGAMNLKGTNVAFEMKSPVPLYAASKQDVGIFDEEAEVPGMAKKLTGFASHSLEITEDNDKKPAAIVNELSPPVPLNVATIEDEEMLQKKLASMPVAVSGLSPPVPFNIAYADDDRLNMKMASNPPAAAISGLGPPVPFNVADVEDSRVHRKIAAELSLPDQPNATSFGMDDSVQTKNASYLELSLESPQPMNEVSTEAQQSFKGDISLSRTHDEESPHIDKGNGLSDDDGNDASLIGNSGKSTQMTASVRPALQFGEYDGSKPIIPEAFLVEERGSEDGNIIDAYAEPLLPWWRQRRTKLLLCGVFVLVTILAIALGISRSTVKEVAVMAISPSSAPSSSMMPSPMPSSCAYAISTNKHKIAIRLDGVYFAETAIDGTNMVVVVKDFTFTVFTIFYSLRNGIWAVRNAFQDTCINDSCWFSAPSLYGKSAMVGFQKGAGFEATVTLYQQNKFYFWEKIEDPFVYDGNVTFDVYNFGSEVKIDGQLACVTDEEYNFLFHQSTKDKKWVLFNKTDGGNGCFISGDIVVSSYQVHSNLTSDNHYFLEVFKYDRDLNTVVPLQDPIVTKNKFMHVSLSQHNLAFWGSMDGEGSSAEGGYDIIIYHRDDMNDKFSFLQRLNFSDHVSELQVVPLALDNDILAFARKNETLIFSEQNGQWKEIIKLNESYQGYQLSGRNLIATKQANEISFDELYYYNFASCVQETPTEAPSIVKTCYWVEIYFVLDKYPMNTSWNLKRVGMENVLAQKSYLYSSTNSQSHNESFCLVEGEYGFAIYDTFGDGICCSNGQGHYNITSNGALIKEGGKFGSKEITMFSIPFIPAPSAMPPISKKKTSTSSPTSILPSSAIPSASSSPTSTFPPTFSPTITHRPIQSPMTPPPTSYPTDQETEPGQKRGDNVDGDN